MVTFGAACRGCPLRGRCTSSRSGRSLTLHDHDALTRAHRRRATDPAFGALYRQHRPMVERTIAWLNRCRRLAKDWENLNRKALAFLRLASIRLMLRKLCNPA